MNSNEAVLNVRCIAFNKYDGSNFRTEWKRGKGFVKFGSRNQLIDETDINMGNAVSLFKAYYAKEMNEFLCDTPIEQITLFFEYLGKNSFAGTHKDGDDKVLILIDAFIGEIQLNPWIFKDTFGKLPFVAQVVYEGFLTAEFIESIRNNVDLSEGVVVKTNDWMCKIKTNAYKAKLKELYGNNWNNFWE